MLRAPMLSGRPSVAPSKPTNSSRPEYKIEELLVKIRELEGTIEKLRSALTSEQTRSKDAVHKIQQSWAKERADWRVGCDAIQSAHRIQFLKATLDLQKQRGLVLQEKENCRRERLARLRRDFNLVKFQICESTQDERAAKMEDDLEGAVEELENTRQSLQGGIDSIDERCDALEKELADKAEQLENALEEKSQIEKTLSGLRAEHTTLLSSSTTKSSELERANLRYEGLQATHAELETTFAEAQAANADLRRQLDKWRNLEHREGDELEELRRAKIDLKIRIEELEAKLEAADKKWKEKKEKVKVAFQEQEQALEEANELAEQLQTEKKKMSQRLADAQKTIQDLKIKVESERSKAEAALEIAKRRTDPSSKSVQVKGKPSAAEPSEDEVEEVIVSPRNQSSTSITANDGKVRNIASPETDDEVQIQDRPPKATIGKGKAKSTHVASENDDVSMKAKKARNKKATSRKAAVVGDNEDGEVRELVPPSKRTSKRKASVGDDDGDDSGNSAQTRAASAKAKPGGNSSKPANKAKATTRQTRPGTSQKAVEVEENDDNTEPGAEAPKKKKRKINLFPSAQATTFNWNDLSQGEGGLNIPTDLSPVKDHDAVLPRPSSRLASVLSWNRR